MNESERLDIIIQCLINGKTAIAYTEWVESVRGWGIYFSKRHPYFDVNKFYKAVGY